MPNQPFIAHGAASTRCDRAFVAPAGGAATVRANRPARPSWRKTRRQNCRPAPPKWSRTQPHREKLRPAPPALVRLPSRSQNPGRPPIAANPGPNQGRRAQDAAGSRCRNRRRADSSPWHRRCFGGVPQTNVTPDMIKTAGQEAPGGQNLPPALAIAQLMAAQSGARGVSSNHRGLRISARFFVAPRPLGACFHPLPMRVSPSLLTALRSPEFP